ncbi:MAG: MATE family efflux transporter, partial [Clostridiales bacterium]
MDKKKYLSLVLPVVLHQLVTTAVSFIDVLMISELGAVNVAAVGICQNLYFIYYLFTTGMAGGMGIFISQYWGQKDIENIRRMLRMALVVVNSALIVLVLGGYFAAETVIHMTAGDAAPEVVQLGVDYFHLAMLSYLFSGVSLCFAYALRSIDKPGPVLLIALLSLGLKVLLNYGLIFGNWGCPAMGIRGAAVALVITRMVEMVMTMLWVYKKEKILAIKFRHLFDFSWPMLKKLMKISLPVMINDVMYAVGMLFYVGAYSRIAVQALAAVEVANTIQNFFTTVVIGLGAATAVVVGNMIGEGRADQVLLVGRRYLWIAIGAGVGVGALMVATIPLTVVIFPIEAAVLAMVRKLL